jgi:hypothetical protein
MKNNLTLDQVQTADYELLSTKGSDAGTKKVKKASWLRTILWMVSMGLLVNVAMAALFYGLYYYKIIH